MNIVKLYPTDTALAMIRAAYDREQEARLRAGLRSESMSAWASRLLLDEAARRLAAGGLDEPERLTEAAPSLRDQPSSREGLPVRTRVIECLICAPAPCTGHTTRAHAVACATRTPGGLACNCRPATC